MKIDPDLQDEGVEFYDKAQCLKLARKLERWARQLRQLSARLDKADAKLRCIVARKFSQIPPESFN